MTDLDIEDDRERPRRGAPDDPPRDTPRRDAPPRDANVARPARGVPPRRPAQPDEPDQRPRPRPADPAATERTEVIRRSDPAATERTEVIHRSDPRGGRPRDPRAGDGGVPPRRPPDAAPPAADSFIPSPGRRPRHDRHPGRPADEQGRAAGTRRGEPQHRRGAGGRHPGDEQARARLRDDRGLAQPFQNAFMNSFTQTIDLTALRRRLEEQDAANRSDTTARPAGRLWPEADDVEGTQALRREPPSYRRRPPADDADELGLRDLDAVDAPRRPPSTWERRGEEPTPAKGTTRSRALWTLLDQLISSGTNSILMFIVAREVVKAEFGAFSAAFAVFAVVIGFSKSTGGAPLGIRYSGAPRSLFTAAAAKATGAALVLGVIAGLGCAVVGTLLGGAVGRALVTLAIVLPGLLVQDLWRQVFFAQGRPAAAAANDAIWGVVQVIGVAVLLARHVALASPMLLAWGAAATVAALIGVVQAGFWPAPARALDWVREHRDINGYLAAEFVTVQGALNATLLVIGAISTIELLGALRGVQTVLGPTTIFAVGIVSWAIPEFSQRKDMKAAARVRAAYLLSAAVAGMGIVWGLAFLVLGQIHIHADGHPDGMPIGEQLLGDTWAGTYHLLGLSIIQQAGAAATVGVSCMLVALGRAKDTFRLNAIMAPQLLLYPVIGAVLGGGTGAVIGFIAANWIMVPSWFRLLGRAAKEAEQSWNESQSARESAGGGTGVGGDQPGGRLTHGDQRDRRGERDQGRRPGPGGGPPASKHLSVE